MFASIKQAFGFDKPRLYSFRAGVPSGVGVGTGRMGFDKPQSDPLYWPVPPDRAVRDSMAPLLGGYMKTVQEVTPVSIKGNGAELTGAIALQALAQFQAGSK